MIEFFILATYMCLCAGYGGGSLPGSKILDRTVQIAGKTINFTWLPELLFALAFGLGHHWLLVPFVVTWSYLWMQSATAPALHWGKGNYNPKRTSTLKPFVDFLAIGGEFKIPAIKKLGFSGMPIRFKGFGWDPSTVEYCRLYMGVKWLLICLPTGIFAPIGAVAAVAAYEGGARYRWHHGITECLSAVGAAAAISLFT